MLYMSPDYLSWNNGNNLCEWKYSPPFLLFTILSINLINPIIAYQGFYDIYIFPYHIFIIVMRCSNIHSGHSETYKKFSMCTRPCFHFVTRGHKTLFVVNSSSTKLQLPLFIIHTIGSDTLVNLTDYSILFDITFPHEFKQCNKCFSKRHVKDI